MTVESRRHGSIQRRVAPTSQLPEIVPGHRLDIPQFSLSIIAVQGSERAGESGRVQANKVHT